MNILIPHNWLLEHLETEATPKEIQKYVSLCGPSIERIYQKEGESVYDIEVTTNRVDSMSIRGIARETAVILNEFNIPAKLKKSGIKRNLNIDVSPNEMLPLPTINNNEELSKRVICIVLKDVKQTQTPSWMAKRLKQTDQNIHHAIIDITNYITHELGHPCHAFDYDKLMKTGGVINVVEAKKGETFTTLDGNTFTTVGGEVVFKNDQGQIIDLPSIKGTANASIDNSTKNILLLLESITAQKVRFASMTHAIRTTAAQLMEKNVDPNLAEDVLLKGVELYQQLTGAKVASKILDIYPAKQVLPPVKVTVTRINEYLGLDLKLKKITTILKKLECRVEVAKDNNLLTVYPPSFRPDLTIPADIVEEIARIYGYHNLPSVLMTTPIPTTRQQGVNFVVEDIIKQHLASIGAQEIYSYSMVNETLAKETASLGDHLKLANPLNDDHVYLRMSLIPSLEKIINNNSQTKKLTVFEITNVYQKNGNNLPNEKLHLAIVSTIAYNKVKGILESLMDKLYIKDMKVIVKPGKRNERVGIIMVDSNQLGAVTILDNNHTAIEIEMTKLLPLVHSHPTYQPLAKTSSITEDMTFTLKEKTLVGDLIETIKNLNKAIVKVELKDKYKQNYSFTITYHDDNKNISTDDVEPVRKQVAEVLSSIYKAKLVGKV